MLRFDKRDTWRTQDSVPPPLLAPVVRQEVSLFAMDEDEDDDLNVEDVEDVEEGTTTTMAVFGEEAKEEEEAAQRALLFGGVATTPMVVHERPEVLVAHLDPENELGNCEYKLHLCEPSNEHLEHLTTQLKWRIEEDQEISLDGTRSAVYFIGVSDNGKVIGLVEDELFDSVNTIRKCCDRLLASFGMKLSMNVTLYSRGISLGKKIAKIVIRTDLCQDPIEEIRITAIGHYQSGKSTLVAVLTTGLLDNGLGLARMHVARHKHEIDHGRTSSVSLHVLEHEKEWTLCTGRIEDSFESGLESNNRISRKVVLQSSSASPPTNHHRIQQQRFGSSPQSLNNGSPSSPFSKLVNLLDTAGHPRYFKTTINGLCAKSPDYAMIILSSLVLLSGRAASLEESELRAHRQTVCKHIRLTCALKRRLFVVVTKTDLVSPEQKDTESLEAEYVKALESMFSDSIPSVLTKFFVAKSDDDAQHCARLLSQDPVSGPDHHPVVFIPVFLVSNVTGDRLPTLHRFLGQLLKPSSNNNNPFGDMVLQQQQQHVDTTVENSGLSLERSSNARTAVLHIAEHFRIDHVGDVVEGWLEVGEIEVGDTLWLGPGDADGRYTKVLIRSIYTAKRTGTKRMVRGQSATLAISLSEEKLRGHLRRGAVLTAGIQERIAVREFVAEFDGDAAPLLKVNRQFVLHFNACSQAARLVSVKESTTSNSKLLCTLRFEFRAEFIKPDTLIIARDSSVLVGKVISIDDLLAARRVRVSQIEARLLLLKQKVHAKDMIIESLM